MAGIYVHIPFCKQACTYCNFHFTTSTRRKKEVVEAICRELKEERAYLEEAPIETIYFGGGTPSILDPQELEQIMQTIRQQFKILPDAEITLEANPDDMHRENIRHWMAQGVNRLSLGVQSFEDSELEWMNRAHHAAQSLEAIQLSQREGIRNLSIDLIYGTPHLSDETWRDNVQRAVDLNIPHLSCYALTVEERTPLLKKIRQKELDNVDPDRQSDQFLLLMEWLDLAGYEHYEVSNFALPGLRSRHNSSYWRGIPYLGVGPSAHSFNGQDRRSNPDNNALYLQGIQSGGLIRLDDPLSEKDRLNEMIMISLRTKEGLDLEATGARFGMAEADRIRKESMVLLWHGLVKAEGSRLSLTREGMLRADGIASNLFAET